MSDSVTIFFQKYNDEDGFSESCMSVLFSLSIHLQLVAELEVQAEEIRDQKDEEGGQTARPGDQVNSLRHI